MSTENLALTPLNAGTALERSVSQTIIRHPISIVLFIQMITMAVTGVVCLAFDSPFILWFRDTPYILLVVLLSLLFLGIIWDGSLAAINILLRVMRKLMPNIGGTPVTESIRRARFFIHGFSPLAMILLTAASLLYTSNITLLNLKMLSTVTGWQDSVYWAIEGRLFEKIVQLPINAGLWDKLYHSAWGIELFAAFLLIIIGRGSRIALRYCVSMILLFYVGRFLGVINPVMGPAFHQPSLFSYLDGSLTGEVMQSLGGLFHITPEQARNSSGVLLGGVSAMPSLHVGMVTLTAYWLMIVNRRLLLITAPWVLLVWTSTVVLGWHYILDGAGGVALGLTCAIVTRRLLLWMKA